VYQLAGVFATRQRLLAGYQFKPLVIDAGGAGRYFNPGLRGYSQVINVNTATTSTFTPSKYITGSDAPPGKIPLLMKFDFNILNKLFPAKSVDVIITEDSTSQGFDVNGARGWLDVLKPGGMIDDFERSRTGADLEAPFSRNYSDSFWKIIRQADTTAARIGPRPEKLLRSSDSPDGWRQIIYPYLGPIFGVLPPIF